MEFKKARINMIQNGFKPNGITDTILLEAFLTVERDYFVSGSLKNSAFTYEDSLDLGQNRFLSNTKVYAKLLQEARIQPHEKILVLPLSCGYYSAIIAYLGNEVWGVETSINRTLFDLPLKTATFPKSKLNTVVLSQELKDGYSEKAPYDVIFIDGAVEEFPSHLWDQVTHNGRIVYVDHSTPNHFYGRVVYKNNPISQDDIFTETEIPVLDDFRRDHVFGF